MTTDAPLDARAALEEAARRWTSLWSAPVDWELFERLHRDDFEDCASGGRPPTKSGFASGLELLVRAFPDLRTEVDEMVVDVERARVAVRWTARGTNLGCYLGVGPTGRETRITGIEIIELAAGRIARRWGEWDISDHLRG
ncbi:MAG: ester cyclase [Planctomycetes bacterium]|nr:ester cyclase [Planctomycetota bacterium]